LVNEVAGFQDMHSFKRLLLHFARNGAVPSVRRGERVDLRYAELSAAGGNIIAEGTKISGRVTLGYASTIGRYSELVGGIITVGSYCSLAPHCAIYAMNHPVTHLTTFVGGGLWKGALKKNQISESVKIGSDVWIGHGAMVLAGVEIGNGAIIGAGAVVTKSVPDFTIALGNPARPFKRRFTDEIVELLQLLKWWEYSPEQLRQIEDLFFIDFAEEPARAAERIRAYLKQPAIIKTVE